MIYPPDDLLEDLQSVTQARSAPLPELPGAHGGSAQASHSVLRLLCVYLLISLFVNMWVTGYCV